MLHVAKYSIQKNKTVRALEKNIGEFLYNPQIWGDLLWGFYDWKSVSHKNSFKINSAARKFKFFTR